ncbi:MAG: hypothetical protein Tsb0010_14460 [Parvularculaceae bacterium]
MLSLVTNGGSVARAERNEFLRACNPSAARGYQSASSRGLCCVVAQRSPPCKRAPAKYSIQGPRTPHAERVTTPDSVRRSVRSGGRGRAFAALYYIGVPFVRAVAFAAGVASTLVIAYALFAAGAVFAWAPYAVAD